MEVSNREEANANARRAEEEDAHRSAVEGRRRAPPLSATPPHTAAASSTPATERVRRQLLPQRGAAVSGAQHRDGRGRGRLRLLPSSQRRRRPPRPPARPPAAEAESE